MKIKEIRDNGEQTFDRYTIVYNTIGDRQGNYDCIGLSSNPTHPQGIGQHSVARPGPHLGKLIRFDDLPSDCQAVILHDLKGESE